MSWKREIRYMWLAGLVASVMAAPGCKRPTEDRRETAQPSESRQERRAEDESATQQPAGSPQIEDVGADSEDSEDSAKADYGPVSTELSAPPEDVARGLSLRRVARGLERPVGLEVAPGDTSGRLFVVEQHVARVRILRPGEGGKLRVDDEPFFDMKGAVSKGNEQGLLGLVFHPDFADNRRLYVNYTDRKGTTRVVEYQVSAEDPDRVDMSTARQIFELEQPYSNHNAGDLEFGPDGKLYVGTGDGGAAGDPLEAGQNAKMLLAKMLRFDVDADEPRPEIVHMGLRNPWRYHFDAATGDMYIADVGQNRWEYVYVLAADDIDGRKGEGHNFGWNVVEGNHCYKARRCDASRFTAAVIEYDHATGCSITGGVVYRGKAIPELDGVYFYADYCTVLIRSFRWQEDGVHQHWEWTEILNPKKRVQAISAFGTDADGEMYVLSLQGGIYKLVRT